MASQVISFNKIKKIDIVNVKGGMTATQVMAKYKPDILMNLALYDMSNGENIVNMEDENKTSGYLFSNYGIGIKNNKELCWTNYSNAKANNDIRDFIGGAPTLVSNGKVNIDWGNKYSSYVNGKHKRTVFGFNDSNLILIVTDNEVTLKEIANIGLNNFGVKYMINCDGGGSCHLQVGSKIYAKSTRKNASWLLIYLKDDDEMTIKVDGKEYEFDAFIKNGVTYIKLRDFEQAGYTIGYKNGIPSIDKPKK